MFSPTVTELPRRLEPISRDASPHHAAVAAWLEDYVSQGHPELGRPGPVCPFVSAARRAGQLDIVYDHELDGTCIDRLGDVMLDQLRDFAATKSLPAKGVSLASRVVVFPAIGEGEWAVVDEVYGRLKDAAIELGLMVGQFHPRCDEPAVRNRAFCASRAPFALFAMRHMAPHDILFLHENQRWFDRYRREFSKHHERGKVKDKLMMQLYRDANASYGSGCPADGRATATDRDRRQEGDNEHG
jgi:hypothetical protein